MLVTILLIFIVVSGCIAFGFSQSGKTGKSSWVQFLAKGKEAGFSVREIEQLRRLAEKCGIDDLSSIFVSQENLELCIRHMARTARLAGTNTDQSTQNFLFRLYDYRTKLEMEKPKNKTGITSTSQISEGQSVRILLGGHGVFLSKIVKVTPGYLVTSRPQSPKLPAGFSWNGSKISVYFWRTEDAGYVFDTVVDDEVFSRGTAALKIRHGGSLFRTQKRKSIRIKLHKAAFLYILDSNEPSSVIETNPGLKSIVEDVSDTGCAITIGGRTEEDLRIKVQFILNGNPVCFSGTVCSVDYNEEKNTSLLHIEADPMNITTRNHILGEVFGLLPEESEEYLPVKIVDSNEPGEEVFVEPDEEQEENQEEQSAVPEDAL